MQRYRICKRLLPLLTVILVISNVICFMGARSVSAGTSDGFIFDSEANNEVSLSGYCGSGADVEIPSTVNGKKVIAVKDNAFKDCTTVTSVKFPDTITSIGNNAFVGCTSLVSVTLTDKITSIGTSAFKNCTSLSSIKIPTGVTTVSESAFENCTSLASATIPSTVTTVNKKAFYNCPKLTQVYLSDKVTTIGEMAFGFIFDSVKNKAIPNPNFIINCSEGSKAYTYAETEGFLINSKDDWQVEENSTGVTITGHTGYKKDLVIPDKIDGKKVTQIGNSAFYEDTLIESVIVPEGVTSIGRWAFAGCKNLKNVKLPDSLTSIGNKAFDSTVKVACCSEKVFKLYSWTSSTTRHSYDNDKDNKCNVCNFDRTAPTPTPTIDPKAFITSAPVVTEAPQKSVGDFVNRCYSIALGREADQAGFTSWSDQLNNGQACGAQVGYGFIFSEEYSAKKTSNEQYVKDLYAMFFGREADTAGYNYWLDRLNKGEKREVIFEGFANSQEFNKLCLEYGVVGGFYVVNMDNVAQGGVNCFVARLYKVCLNRLPDQGGQAGWVNKLVAGTATGTSCAKGFIMSEEFAKLKLSNADFVAYMYRAFFGREADNAGLENWVSQLERGASRESVFKGFADSAEFESLCKQYGIKVK